MCSSPSTGASLGVVEIKTVCLQHCEARSIFRSVFAIGNASICNGVVQDDSCDTRHVTHLESSTRSTQLTLWVNSTAASSGRFAEVSPVLAMRMPVELFSSCELVPGVRYCDLQQGMRVQRSTGCERVGATNKLRQTL
jgi:hypothetical protein